MDQTSSARHPRAYLSEFTTNQLHLRNPYILVIWSLLTPGLGNLLQDRKFKGLVLVIWGIIVNTSAKINLAILYTFTGRFQLARQVVDTRWLLLYVAVYVYAAWDAYRATVDMNQLYLLADMEDAPIKAFTIKTFDLNYLGKRHPWVASMWSAMMPGLGNLYLHRLVQGLFFVAWTITVMYFSHGLQAAHLSLIGDFTGAKSVIEPQWFLYLPPIYGCQLYDSYVACVELNKLFEKAQSRWIRDTYQQATFKMPILSR